IFCGNYGSYTDCSCASGCPTGGCGSLDCSSYPGYHGACCTVDNIRTCFCVPNDCTACAGAPYNC
ncbi:unnamed protein product, partial [Rotaria sp. Silwood1]